MSIQAAKEELNSLTEFQREIHVVSDVKEDIISNFYKVFTKSTWYSSLLMKLKRTADGDEVIYSVNNSFHFLMYSYLRFILPPIRVKPEYKGRVRIAWCHNVGTNIISQAVFKEDDDTYQTWDNYWTDMYFQYFQYEGAGKREAHNIGIGNIECLEGWTEFLPSYPINVDQPWFYSMDHALAFPIFYKNTLTRAEHRYTFRRKITDLLRIQILDNKEQWRESKAPIDKYLDVRSTATFGLPELWGRYAYITEAEVKWYKCQTTRIFYIRDVAICDTPNPNKYKSNAEITLHCTNPCLAFFWVAENRDATANRNFSNYTTDTNDLYNGWDPIKTTSLTYGTTARLDRMPSDHFSLAEPRKHFPSTPNERGYHGCSFSWDSTSYHGDIGMVFANMNAKLICHISNNNIFNNNNIYKDGEEGETEDEDEIIDLHNGKLDNNKQNNLSQNSGDIDQSPSFITRVRLLVVRKFTISLENDQYKFSID